MLRILAYPFVAFMAFGVVALSIVLIWSVGFDGKAGDLKGIGSLLLFIVWWSWAGISVYRRYIKKPREEKKQRCSEAALILEKIVIPGIALSTAIEDLRGRFPLVGEPRHRGSLDTDFDSTVELETEAFIVSLFSKDGCIKKWSIR